MAIIRELCYRKVDATQAPKMLKTAPKKSAQNVNSVVIKTQMLFCQE